MEEVEKPVRVRKTAVVEAVVDTAPETVEEKAKLPSKIKMQKMMGYIDDDGQTHLWYENQVIDDADDVARVLSRNFPYFEVLE